MDAKRVGLCRTVSASPTVAISRAPPQLSATSILLEVLASPSHGRQRAGRRYQYGEHRSQPRMHEAPDASAMRRPARPAGFEKKKEDHAVRQTPHRGARQIWRQSPVVVCSEGSDTDHRPTAAAAGMARSGSRPGCFLAYSRLRPRPSGLRLRLLLLPGLRSAAGLVILIIDVGLVPLSGDRRGFPRRNARVALGDLPGRADERTDPRSPILELGDEISVTSATLAWRPRCVWYCLIADRVAGSRLPSTVAGRSSRCGPAPSGPSGPIPACWKPVSTVRPPRGLSGRGRRPPCRAPRPPRDAAAHK